MVGLGDAWPSFYYFCIPTSVLSILFSLIDNIQPLGIYFFLPNNCSVTLMLLKKNQICISFILVA